MAKANGKVILLGEHAVVYGHSALVAGIENGAEAKAIMAHTSSISIGSHTAPNEMLVAAFAALRKELNAPPLEAKVALKIPAGCGLGASAAAAVAVARAALDALDPAPVETPKRLAAILSAANAWERVFHGNPSGIDAAAATLGGCLSFSRQSGANKLTVGTSLHIAIAEADAPASTRVMVEGVAALRATDEARINGVLSAIGRLVATGQVLLREGSLTPLGALMNDNHALLQKLEVSTPRLDHACNVARAAGALGAKLTGSGGGGCVIALCDADPTPVLQAWKAQGLPCFATVVERT